MLKISISKFKYYFVITPYLMSATVFVLISSTFSNFLLAWKLIAFVWIGYEYLRRQRLSTFDLAVFSYFLVWLISTFINEENLIEYCKEIVVMMFYMFYCENAGNKNELDLAINATRNLLFLELFINLICIFFFPNGLWQTSSAYNVITDYYFLGMDNQATPLIIISLVLLVLYYHKEKKISLALIVYAIIIVSNSLLMGSATCVAGVIVFFVFLIISNRYSRVFNIRTALIFVILIFLLFVVFRAQNMFEFFIVNVLHRDVGFSARTGIWDKAMQLIKEKPLIGYGCRTFSTIVGDRHAHNMYLQIILQSGLAGFSCMLNYIRVAIKNSNHLKYSTLWASTILAYGICCLMEVYNQGYLILILAICVTLNKYDYMTF